MKPTSKHKKAEYKITKKKRNYKKNNYLFLFNLHNKTGKIFIKKQNLKKLNIKDYTTLKKKQFNIKKDKWEIIHLVKMNYIKTKPS